MPRRLTLHRSLFGSCLLLAGVVPVFAGPELAPGDGSATNNERLLPGLYPVAPVDAVPSEPYEPFFDVDWSVGLRGSYTKDDDGDRYRALLVPELSLSHEGRRASIGFDGGAEIILPVDGAETHLGAFSIEGEASYAIDSVTTLTGRAGLAYERPDASDPGIADTIETPADRWTGTLGANVARSFGRFNVSVDGEAERSVYGETTLTDGTTSLNGDENVWALEGGLRVGYQLTPIFEVFGRGSVGRDIFDHASPSLGAKTDATDYAFSAGVLGKWNGILEAEASVGTGLRRFDAASLGDIRSTLFDAHLTFTPDPTVRFSVGAGSEIEPAGVDNAGIARIETTADAELEYTVNSWLRLRADADWYTAKFVGTDDTETGYGLGVGADYKVNRHTQLSADYGFDQVAKSGAETEDSHRVTVGIAVVR